MNKLIELLITPFIIPFMQRAILIILITSIVCAILSCFLILKGWSLIGDALSHAVLPGIILAFIIGIPLSIGAFISGICYAFSIGYLKNHSRIKEETIMGIVFSGMFAFGLVLFTYIDTNQHLTHILFGNPLGINDIEFKQTIYISIITLIIIFIKYKDLILFCFDPNHAIMVGLNIKLLHYGLLTLLALTVVACLQTIGVILIVAMLISPGIIAFILSQNFNKMVFIAIITSTTSSLIGTIISFYIDAATSPCIVLIQAIYFILALIWLIISTRYIKNMNIKNKI